MTKRDRSAERFIESLAASEVPPLRTEAKETPGREASKQAANSSFIGSVSGDVIFFGEVPPNALEMILARRAQRQQKS